MLKLSYCRYFLNFKETAITSRSSMNEKETFFIKIFDEQNPDIFGIGECPLFRGLSAEDAPDYEAVLRNFCKKASSGHKDFSAPNSSITFGYESAISDLQNRINNTFPSQDINIPINGLIWMGDKQTMYRRICDKLNAGFRCIKLKIGGIDFEEEISLLDYIRTRFSVSDLELRLDANGAFSPDNALKRLSRLAKYGIHSIEQPIKQHQWADMQQIIRQSPIPIALDEELIGTWDNNSRATLLDSLQPHYIILKPALCGGFDSADKWIAEAEKRNIGWWATSALESNVGLAAITIWLASHKTSMPQGLGTGALYTNNFPSPLSVVRDEIVYHHALPPVTPTLTWVDV
ncbi:MAG: o-succinylbenzoate synthase [Muribaculaceae bacterium]